MVHATAIPVRGWSRIVLAMIAMLVASGDRAVAQTLSERLKGESAKSLAVDAREKGSAARGAILFTRPEPGCTKCHVAGSAEHLGPDLTRFGPDATDSYLIESLLEPSKVIRKGYETATITTLDGKTVQGRIVERTDDRVVLRDLKDPRRVLTMAAVDIDEITLGKMSAMPANVVDALKDRGEFLDVARYMMDLAAVAETHPRHVRARGGKQVSPELQGLALIKDYNCAACHRDDLSANPVTVKRAPQLAWAAGRIDPRYLEKYLADPLHVKPGTTMPDLMTALPADQRSTVATELTHYIVTLGNRPFVRQAIDAKATDRGRELFHTVGCVACHPPRDDAGRETLAGRSVPLGPLAEKYNRDGLTEFLKNPHDVRPSGRMPGLHLTHWEAIDISNYLLSDNRPAAEPDEPFRPDAALAARGKQAFDTLGCARCHDVGAAEGEPMAQPLSRVSADRGCLSEKIGAWPTFDLRQEQRKAVRAALARKPGPLTADAEVALTLTAFRCLNCHQRDELGGVSDERSAHFQTTNPNLGPQGRIPPPLTQVGAKLHPNWLRQVLVSGRAIRPYVKTRMPRFGEDNVGHLVDLFGRVDRQPAVDHGTFKDVKEIRKVGTEMVGTGGLNCIACHTFQLKRAANMSAVDLTEMAERLQKDWFYRYMRDPQRLNENTIMPSFWPGGRAVRRDILDGDTDDQIEALWQYLLEGRQARPPQGLIREPIELLAADEAVMLRRSYPGIGKRGIGVGYANPVNLAFDVEQMRLGMIWKGKFAEPSGVWRGQGHGTVRPLGTDLIRFPTGPDLDVAASPWVPDDGRPPTHRFRGYTLDKNRRPTFRYRVGDVAVDDFPADVVDSAAKRTFLRRTLTVTSASESRDLVFRVAEGKAIRDAGDGEFVIDKLLRIRIDAKHAGRIVKRSGVQQLQVPVTATGDATTLTIDYIW